MYYVEPYDISMGKYVPPNFFFSVLQYIFRKNQPPKVILIILWSIILANFRQQTYTQVDIQTDLLNDINQWSVLSH